MVSLAACECGAEEQTVNHVVLQCPTHRPSHGLHDLTVLDEETIEWLLNTSPEISCSQAVVKRTCPKDEDELTHPVAYCAVVFVCYVTVHLNCCA